MDRDIELPARVRSTVAHAGARGQAWVAALPAVVAELERRWSITVGEPLAGGSAAFVAEARTTDGTPAVVKIGGLVDDMRAQLATMQAAAGQGYARVLAADPLRHAVLLERLGPSLEQLAPPADRQLAILCDTARAAWQPVPPGATAADARAKATFLAELVSRLSAGHHHVVATALACARRREAAADLGRAVVVHGDPHPANTLSVPVPRAGAESGFVFVDPDGFVCDPAYDVGVILRDWTDELLASADPVSLHARWRRTLAARTGLDADAIRDWAYLERVSTGLYLLDLGEHDLGRPFLTTAAALAADVPA